MKILIPLLFICNLCWAQADVFDVVKTRSKATLYSNDTIAAAAKRNALAIMSSYQEDDHNLLQAVVDGLNNSWFSDLDVFLGYDMPTLLKSISEVKDAFFLEHKGRILIDVSETNELCLVTIYTIP